MRPAPALVLALALGCAACSGASSTLGRHPVARRATGDPVRALVNTRYEITFDAPTSGHHPDDVVVRARFVAPSGSVIETGAFPSRGHFKVRYTPREIGTHRWEIVGGEPARTVARGELDAVASRHRGFVRVDPDHRARLVYDDGTTAFVLGENRVNAYDPAWGYARADVRAYVERMAAYGMTTLRVQLFAACAPEPSGGRPPLGCLEMAPGRFDERTAESFDALFDVAEAVGVDVVLVAFARGFTPGREASTSWSDNPYSRDRHGPLHTPKDFFLDAGARHAAIRKLRYISDRWGASPRLLALDLLDEPERDGPIDERVWIPWAEALATAWRGFDPYAHLVTAGPVGPQWNVTQDERAWYESPANDLVQWHLSGEEMREPHVLASAMLHMLGETTVRDKAVLCGSFGLAAEDRATYDHTHVGLWSLAMSGAGVLASSGPDEPMSPERARHFATLSGFLRSLDPRRRYAPLNDIRAVRPESARIWSLATADEADRALWILAPEEGYGTQLRHASITLSAPRGARYRVTWIDDVTGQRIATERVAATDDDMLALLLPPFVRHLAGRLTHED